MNLRNLGIVFSPTLAIPPPLFSLLLSEFDVCSVCALRLQQLCSHVLRSSSLPSSLLPDCRAPSWSRRTRKTRPRRCLETRCQQPWSDAATGTARCERNCVVRLFLARTDQAFTRYEATGANQLMESDTTRSKLRGTPFD